MSEADVVNSTKGLPPTVESLTSDLKKLGIEPGMVLLVHSSLKSIGWVVGGAQAVIMALENAVGDSGTIVMPTFTTSNGEPSGWQHPPVPGPWWQIIRDHMPAYDPDISPTREMGAISETFRKHRGAIRSSHPELSFASKGPMAEKIILDHQLSYGLGDNSPLARIYELDGRVLLLGVGHKNNTSMHLAEYRTDAPGYSESTLSASMIVDGKREWVHYNNINFNEDLFEPIGEDFDSESGIVRMGKIGQAESRLFPQRAVVDFTKEWLEREMPKRLKGYGA